MNEHGAHLIDYASHHLDPDRAVAAVAVALRTCSGHPEPGNVTDRARLLAAVRRECAAEGGRSKEYRPGPGPGTPDDEAVRRAWTLVDPLGAETLRLLYRHELSPRDLSYVLALPVREVGGLIARTQDTVEILVSGLDSLARGRPICSDIAPLAAAVFPTQATGELVTADLPAAARSALLRHIVTCLVCKRPINIRYTAPQILSRPPITALAPEVRNRLTEALSRADAIPQAGPPPLPASRPPASFGVPLGAPVTADPAPAAPTAPTAPAAPTVPALPALPAGREREEEGTPLYDALLSQIRARTAEARFGETTAPAIEPGSLPVQHTGPMAERAREPEHVLDRKRGTAGPTERTAPHALPRDREHEPGSRSEIRLLDVIVRVGAVIRATAIRIVIVVVAGAAGTVAGINLLAPAQPRSSAVESTAGEATAALPTSAAMVSPGAEIGAADPDVTEPEPLSVGGLRIPSVIELDDFGRGDITLTTTSGKALKWRIVAPGLIVKPSHGTLRPGQRDVIRVRALQVRYWCGPPPPVTAQLVLHGPSDSGTATVHWRTC